MTRIRLPWRRAGTADSLKGIRMLESLMAMFAEAPLWSLGIMLFVAACVEYIVPPLPGDTLTLFGLFLVVREGHPLGWSFACVTAGAVCGGLAVYGLGRWLGTHQKWQSWSESRPEFRLGVARVKGAFERHGSKLLLLNRFLPAMRAFVFLGAGLSRISMAAVLVYGGISAILWNALLLVAGYYLAVEWDALLALVSTYNAAALTIVAVGVAGWW